MRLIPSIAFIVLSLLPFSCFAWTGQVVHVADGGTITVTRNGQHVKVRLYGIDTPGTSPGPYENSTLMSSNELTRTRGGWRKRSTPFTGS